MKTMEHYIEEEEFEHEMEKAMAEVDTKDQAETDEATKTLIRVFGDSQKGFEDRRISLENQIAVRQAELADIKIAIESINVAMKSIEAGRSLKDHRPTLLGEKPTPSSGISMAKANAR